MSLPYYKNTLMDKLNKSLQAITNDNDNNITRWYGSHGDEHIARGAQHNNGLINSHLFINKNRNKCRNYKYTSCKEHYQELEETSSQESSEPEHLTNSFRSSQCEESQQQQEESLQEEDNTNYKEYNHKNNNEKQEKKKRMKMMMEGNIIVDDSILDNTLNKKWMSCDILRFIDAALLHGVPEDIIANHVQILAAAMHESVQREAQVNALRHHSRVMAFEMREVLNCMERTNLELEQQRESDLEKNKSKLVKEQNQITEESQERNTEVTNNITNSDNITHEETDQEKARAVLFIRRQPALPCTIDNIHDKKRRYSVHSAPSLTQLITTSHSHTLELREQTERCEQESVEQREKHAAEKGYDLMSAHNTDTSVASIDYWNLNGPLKPQGSSNIQTSKLSLSQNKALKDNSEKVAFTNVQYGKIKNEPFNKQPVFLSRPIIQRSAIASESKKKDLSNNNGITQTQSNNQYINESIDDDNNDNDANDTHRTHSRTRLCETCARIDNATMQNYEKHNNKEKSLAIKHHMLPTHSSIRMHRKEEGKGNSELEQQNEERELLQKCESSTSPFQKEQMLNYSKPLFRYKPPIPVRQTHTSRLRLSRSRSNTSESSNIIAINNDNAIVSNNEKSKVENAVKEYNQKDAKAPVYEILHKENERPLREPPHLPTDSAMCIVLKGITANTMISVEPHNDNVIGSNNHNLIDNHCNINNYNNNNAVSSVYSAKAKQTIRQALRDSQEKMQNADRLLQQCTMNASSQHK